VAVITNTEQVTPEWLGRVLGTRVADIRFETPMRGNSRIIPLEVGYSEPGDAPTRLILKLSAEEIQDRREVDFYRAVTGIRDLPIIRCYDAAFEDGRFHILMEDLQATHDPHPPSFLPPTIANAERIVDALAQFHAFWWDSERLGEIGEIPSEESIKQAVAEDVALLSGFADFLGDRLSDERKKLLERAGERLLSLRMKRLIPAHNLTLIHHDLHAGNLLYPKQPEQDTIRLIDWKSWSINPGANDLANMMVVYWMQERRQQLQDGLLRRYHHRLTERGIANYSWADCWYDYRLAVIGYLFFPIWQWSVGTPDFIWWHNFDRVMLAYRDLECGEFL
jgi:thiamine kinase-like enzyme